MRFVDKMENCVFCSLAMRFMFYNQNVTKTARTTMAHIALEFMLGTELGQNVSCRRIKVLKKTAVTAVLGTLLVTISGHHSSFELYVFQSTNSDLLSSK